VSQPTLESSSLELLPGMTTDNDRLGRQGTTGNDRIRQDVVAKPTLSINATTIKTLIIILFKIYNENQCNEACQSQ